MYILCIYIYITYRIQNLRWCCQGATAWMAVLQVTSVASKRFQVTWQDGVSVASCCSCAWRSQQKPITQRENMGKLHPKYNDAYIIMKYYRIHTYTYYACVYMQLSRVRTPYVTWIQFPRPVQPAWDVRVKAICQWCALEQLFAHALPDQVTVQLTGYIW